jgi:hypothetical protein
LSVASNPELSGPVPAASFERRICCAFRRSAR